MLLHVQLNVMLSVLLCMEHAPYVRTVTVGLLDILKELILVHSPSPSLCSHPRLQARTSALKLHILIQLTVADNWMRSLACCTHASCLSYQ